MSNVAYTADDAAPTDRKQLKQSLYGLNYSHVFVDDAAETMSIRNSIVRTLGDAGIPVVANRDEVAVCVNLDYAELERRMLGSLSVQEREALLLNIKPKQENNMFKKSVALTILGSFMSGLRSMSNKLTEADPVGDMLGKSRPKTRSSKGKGRTSTKPSGAAALKRAATKRNNIRKHK